MLFGKRLQPTRKFVFYFYFAFSMFIYICIEISLESFFVFNKNITQTEYKNEYTNAYTIPRVMLNVVVWPGNMNVIGFVALNVM